MTMGAMEMLRLKLPTLVADRVTTRFQVGELVEGPGGQWSNKSKFCVVVQKVLSVTKDANIRKSQVGLSQVLCHSSWKQFSTIAAAEER